MLDKKVNLWFTYSLMDDLRIHHKIRSIRRQNLLTLEEVARRTGFTRSYLSMIELGKKSPPIASLSKIARALGIHIGAFFEKRKPEDHILLIRKGKGKMVARDGSIFGYRYEAVAPTKRGKKMEPFIISLPPNSREGPLFDHEGEEFFYVLEGKIQFLYGDKKYRLGPGDCIYFDSSIPHRAEGGDPGKKSKALVVIYNP